MKANVNLSRSLTPFLFLALTLGLTIATAFSAPSVPGDEDWLADSCNFSGNASDPAIPEISSFEISPRVLIIDDDAESVTLKADIIEGDIPVQSLEALFISPSGSQSKRVLMNGRNLISPEGNIGNNNNKNVRSYAGRIAFVPASEPGNWSLQHLLVCDNASLCRKLDGREAERLGFAVTLQIKKSEGRSPRGIEKDIEGPEGPAIDPDLDELRGWANTDRTILANRKIIINNVFNRPAICWP